MIFLVPLFLCLLIGIDRYVARVGRPRLSVVAGALAIAALILMGYGWLMSGVMQEAMHESSATGSAPPSSPNAGLYGTDRDSTRPGEGEASFDRYPPHNFFAGSPFRSIWIPTADLLPDSIVDVYPSQEDALLAAATDVSAVFSRRPGSTIELQPTPDSPPLSELLIQDLQQEIRRSLATVKSHVGLHSATRLFVRLVGESDAGSLQTLTINEPTVPPKQGFNFSASFENKTWVSNPQKHLRQTDNESLIVGHSASFWPTAVAAETDAWFALTAQLAYQLGNLDYASKKSTYHFPELRSLANALRDHPEIQDHFTQRIEGSERTVYRSAVLLLDAKPLLRRFDSRRDNPLDWTDQNPVDQYLNLQEITESIDPAEFARPAPQRIPFTTPPRPIYLPRLANQYPKLLSALGLTALIALTLILYRSLNRWSRGQRQGFFQIAAVSALFIVAAVLGVLSL